MNALELRRLSSAELHAYYSTLRADRLPLGTFEGSAWPIPIWPLWRGKVFGEPDECLVARVKNRVGPWLLVRGLAYRSGNHVIIDYPQLGLQDRLKPVNEKLWLGKMDLRWGTLWFTLSKEPEK